jgi:hypothetical protein
VKVTVFLTVQEEEVTHTSTAKEDMPFVVGQGKDSTLLDMVNKDALPAAAQKEGKQRKAGRPTVR